MCVCGVCMCVYVCMCVCVCGVCVCVCGVCVVCVCGGERFPTGWSGEFGRILVTR